MKTVLILLGRCIRNVFSGTTAMSGTAWCLVIFVTIAWINTSCATTKPIPTPEPSPVEIGIYTVEAAQTEWTKYVSAGHATATEELAYNVALTNRDKAVDDLKIAFAIWLGRTTTPSPDVAITMLNVDEALTALDNASGKLLAFVNQTVRNKKQVVDMPPIPRP